ncbi:hypothetical protein KY333_04725, partial [Candidatus Woesearchaeota archaeon]|nr:hypothetical protein [Candidatus Woesearchaeota archaeon]
NLVDNLINIKSMAKLFDLNNEVLADLTKGRSFEKVPGVDYYIVAGSQTYNFNLGFFSVTSAQLFDILDINDGIITTQSASFVGGEFIADACADYFEVKLTHTELIDASIPRRVIARIISEDKIIENPDYAYLGYNQYVDLKTDNCDADEYYIVVGKRISELETPGVLYCSCGNGVCGEGETPDTCPQDCMNLYALGSLCMFLPLMILLLLIILVALTSVYFVRKYVKKVESGNTWQGILWFFVFVTLLALLMLWFMCKLLPLVSWIVLILVGVALFIDLAMPRFKELAKEQ